MVVIKALLTWRMDMKMNRIPRRQDIVWINFIPTLGQGIRGRHPAVVLSNSGYTKLTGLVAVSPITHGTNNRLKKLFIPINFNDEAGYINPLQFFTFSCKKRDLKVTDRRLDTYNYAKLIRLHMNIIE